MKLVLIVGSGAVGKMTVGQELMKITDLRLFHNHMMIEPVIDIFGYFKGDTILKLREIIFDDFTKSDCYGMIHTLTPPSTRLILIYLTLILYTKFNIISTVISYWFESHQN